MNWKSIDTQQDLDDLDNAVCWSDSNSEEYYASSINEDYFPTDVSRGGRVLKNVHILCRTDSRITPYLEMVWIDADNFNFHFLQEPHMMGTVDALKRVEISCRHDGLEMRCSRLIYRFLDEHEVGLKHYFIRSLAEPEA